MRKDLDLRNLEDIAKGFSESNNPIEDGNPLKKPQVYVDFDKVQDEMHDHAQKVIDSYVDFWIMDESLRTNDVIQNKRKMDILNLSDMLFSIWSSMYSLKKVLCEIDTGNINPRLIDTQTALLNKKKDYNEKLALMQVYLNDSYKAIKNQYEMKRTTDGERALATPDASHSMSATEVLNDVVSRGQKDLLLRMREM
jgi:hypothetical protein